MAIDPPAQARVSLPEWLWGGDPTRLLAECRYRSRRERTDGAHLVQPEETYRHQTPDLVRVRTITEPGNATGRLTDLSRLRERIVPPIHPEMSAQLERRRLQAEKSGGVLDLLIYEQLVMYVVPIGELAHRAQYFLDLLKEMPLESDPSAHPFENAALTLVEIDPALLHRIKIASVWLRIKQDLRLQEGDLSHIRSVEGEDEAFGSSSGLYNGVLTLDAYLAPLLACATPGVWGLHVMRTFGSLLFSFGRRISGTAGRASEPLHLISVPGATDPIHFDELSPRACTSATRWWIERLNEMFGVMSDLSVFTDSAGDYRADKHLESVLTIEQIFRRLSSLMVAHRDTNARRTLFFSVLDSFQRTNGWDLLTMCKLSHAEAVLARLEESLGEAAELLLPVARRGVGALRSMQRGFFISRQLGTADVELQLAAGKTKTISAEEATARYLKVLRDATHGHGGKGKSIEETAALLAHHDGNVPHDIGLLAYLYLLDMLLESSRLRRCLYAGGR